MIKIANKMLTRLREKDKNGLFKPTQTSICYPTGFISFDYRNGYLVEVRDLKEVLIKSYPAIGIVGGTFITVAGKPGTAKTTWAIQAASNIVKPFVDNAFVQHYDLEQALNYTRIKNVNLMTQQELDDKYILKQEKNYIEDIFKAIMLIGFEKETNKVDYTYDTGWVDEFNRPIKAYVPTVVIIDSIPLISSKEAFKDKEMEGGTYANRVAKAIAQLYKGLMPIIKTYNITVIAINHITSKIEISAFIKTQPQLLYMKLDQNLPGGHAPLFLANTLLNFTALGSEKFKQDEHGFDGFPVRCDFLKSRTNKAGQFATLIYNQVTGFDSILSQLRFAEDNNLISGRNPYRYINGFKDLKFDSRKFKKEFNKNEKLRFALFESTIPILEKQLSHVDPDVEDEVDVLDLCNKLESAQDLDVLEEVVNIA